MKIEVQNIEQNTAAVDVIVSLQEFEPWLNKAYHKTKRYYSFPGFRKGKVPRKLIENRYGKDVFYRDAAAEFLDNIDLTKILEENGLVPFLEPDLLSFDRLDDGALNLSLSVPLNPTVEIPSYQDLTENINIGFSDVTEDEVQLELEMLARENPIKVHEAETYEENTNARIKVRAFLIDDDSSQYLLDNELDGLGTLVLAPDEPLEADFLSISQDQIRQQLLGHKIGDKVELNQEITIPSDAYELVIGRRTDLYEAPDYFPLEEEEEEEEEKETRTLHYLFEIKDIYTTQTPEIDDTFAQRISFSSTLDDFKKEIKNLLKSEKNAGEDLKLAEAAYAYLINNAQIEFPPAYTNLILEGEEVLSTKTTIGRGLREFYYEFDPTKSFGENYLNFESELLALNEFWNLNSSPQAEQYIERNQRFLQSMITANLPVYEEEDAEFFANYMALRHYVIQVLSDIIINLSAEKTVKEEEIIEEETDLEQGEADA